MYLWYNYGTELNINISIFLSQESGWNPDPAQQDTTNPTQQEVDASLFGNESDAEKDFKRLVKDPLEEMLNKLNGEGETI